MRNYNSTTVAGESFQRCCRISIANQRGQVPVVRFQEERVTVLSDGREIVEPLGMIEMPFDPSATIELFDPVTDAPLGRTGSQGDAHVLLYSAYKQQALKRDAELEEARLAAAEQESPTP